MIIAASGLTVAAELRERIADLYGAYDDALDEVDLDRWPEFFTESCVYRIVPRENYERGLPLSVMACESRAMLVDRVVALREATLFAPRIVRHLTGSVRLVAAAADGLRLRASFALFQTLTNQPSELLMCGRYHDRVVEDEGVLRFAERVCVYDSAVIPISLVYPV
jgi:3-phenylpropionate/cinnamic acid dioxygenase small subunit